MQRICCDVSVQTEAETHVEQCTQVDRDQSTEWTQCTVSQTDQSVQAICRQSPATIQVAPETSDAAIQTLSVVTEPADELGLCSAVSEEKLVSKSEVASHCQVEKQLCIVASDEDGEIAHSPFAAESNVEVIEESPSGGDSASSNEHLQRQEDHSTPTTGASFICDKSDTVAAQTQVTSATIPTVIDQLPNQYDPDEVAAVVRYHCPPTTVSVRTTCQPQIVEPSFSMSTGAKYSLEQQTFLASSLMLQQSSEIRSLCYGSSQTASIQKIRIQQLVHEIPLLSNTQALVSLDSAAQARALNAEPVFEACTTNPIERSSEMGSNHSIITDTSASLKPLDAAEAVSGSSQPSTNLQQSILTVHNGNSSTKSQISVAQEMTTNMLSSCALLPSVPNVVPNASLPVTKVTKSASVNYLSRLTAHLEQLIANEPDQQCKPPTTHGTTEHVVQDANCSGDVMLLDDESDKSGSRKQSENVLQLENVVKQHGEQLRASESQSIHTCAQNNSVSHLSNTDVATVCAGSGAKSEHSNDKEQKATVQTEVETSMARLSDCIATSGRSRRPLFVCRGPLMESVTTLEDSDSMSPSRKLHRDSECSRRRLPEMLMGMFAICHYYQLLAYSECDALKWWMF